MNITELIFSGANLFVLPFWALMILLPQWGVTQKVIGSRLPFVVLAGLYVYLIAGTLNSDAAAALANPQLADIARFFSEEQAAATGWVHFLTMDLFVGRWVYLEGQRTGVWTIHSLLLCLFAGPLGLLVHILTAWLTGWLKRDSVQEEATSPASS
ncbi:MAG: DUF4281 domain-containing protein [Spirulinaceae cyanobacterium SM2_1_0]|nr:DUF4281 domain-containing protein [Spirulinaceae cyanobacterium SM2_1_0]NJO52681.1 DUF4281 domain-containing protein [Leptolyngbyaceae cyanobacterium RM2_2_4]